MKLARMSKLCDNLSTPMLVLITGMCWLLWLSRDTEATDERNGPLTIQVPPEHYEPVNTFAQKLRKYDERL